MTTAREDLLAAGLAVFDRDGFEGATVAAIRTRARASNGSFFHFFGSKKELAGALFLEVLQRYHAAVLTAIDTPCGAQEGIDRLIRAHLDWVVNSRREARYLFEISRSEWSEEVSNNAIEVYVHRLRKKIEIGGLRIATVRGLGYCLEKFAEPAANTVAPNTITPSR